MAPDVNYYKNIPNPAEIEAIFEPYDMAECMSDLEFFPEFMHDLIDDHPGVAHLSTVLDRMLAVALRVGGFGL